MKCIQTLDQDFSSAVEMHNSGNLAAASDIYKRILMVSPHHKDVNNNLGVLSLQIGDYVKAVDCFDRVLSSNPQHADAHLNRGRAQQALGDIDRALVSYDQALKLNGTYFQAYNNKGAILRDQGNLDDAIDCFRLAIEINPDYPEALNNLARSLHDQGRLEEALSIFHWACTIAPDYFVALTNMARVLLDLGRYDDALSGLRRALEIDSSYALAHLNMGNTFRHLERFREAIASYDRALTLDPEDHEALNCKGCVFMDLGDSGMAINYFDQSLNLKADYETAHYNRGLMFLNDGDLNQAVTCFDIALSFDATFTPAIRRKGVALNALGRRQDALNCFKESLELVRGELCTNPNLRSFRIITKPKIDHDIEQFRYLAERGINRNLFLKLAKTFEKLRGQIQWESNGDFFVALSDEQHQCLANSYNRPLHFADAPATDGSTLNSELSGIEITNQFNNGSHGIACVDNLLTVGALATLRRYLLESTIWYDFEHAGGYLGAYLGDGLACPLLLQIADDLRRTLPEIIKDHKLLELWAYKYDSQLNGIGMHADFAAVNINFWITPDRANRDPDHGGLVIEKIKAPLDWGFKAYNSSSATARNRKKQFVERHSAGEIVFAHRENRMVIFDSRLFHKTDTINFEPGYENRRINITMLFGNGVQNREQIS